MTYARQALSNPFFNELRAPNVVLPNETPMPSNMFDFTPKELQALQSRGLVKQVVPPHLLAHFFPSSSPVTNVLPKELDSLTALSASGYVPGPATKRQEVRPSRVSSTENRALSSLQPPNPLRRAGLKSIKMASGADLP